MEAYKREFIEFLEGAGVLKFGDFTAKSGRKIPYFINAGEPVIAFIEITLISLSVDIIHSHGDLLI